MFWGLEYLDQLTYSRWLEDLREDPCPQGKLLSLVSSWLFCIFIPGAILKGGSMVKINTEPGRVSQSTGK